MMLMHCNMTYNMVSLFKLRLLLKVMINSALINILGYSQNGNLQLWKKGSFCHIRRILLLPL